MTKKTLHFAVDGSDSNPGTYKSPKRSPQSINTLGLKPGDRVLFRQGDAFAPDPKVPLEANTFVLVKTSGVTFDSYATGSEKAANPSFSHTGKKSVVWGFLGDDNVTRHLDIWNGETCIANYQDHSGNQFESLRIQNFGDGLVDKASNTTIRNCYFAHGWMVKDTGDASDYGARAIVLERYKGTPHTNTHILECFIEECMAPSKAFGTDGAGVEFFGGVELVLIEGCFVRRVKIMSEFGAVTSAKETLRNITFSKNMITGPLAYFNPTTNAYYGDIDALRYQRNTVINDDEKKSPVFLSGAWGDLSKRLIFTNNLMTSPGVAFFNADAGTDLTTITRSGNVYSGAEVGMALTNGESIQEIPFVNAQAGDYRLSCEMLMPDGTPYTPGAWGLARDGEEGVYSVPSMKELMALSGTSREGRRVYVGQAQMVYQMTERGIWLKTS